MFFLPGDVPDELRGDENGEVYPCVEIKHVNLKNWFKKLTEGITPPSKKSNHIKAIMALSNMNMESAIFQGSVVGYVQDGYKLMEILDDNQDNDKENDKNHEIDRTETK